MRSTIVATALALSTLVALPAFAAQPAAEGAAAQVRHGHGKDAKFPMAGAEFKQKFEARTAKARARLEERVAKMSAQEAQQARAKFDAGVAKIGEEVQKAVADGTVTKEEAQRVRQVAREVHPRHGGHGGKHGNKKSA